MTPGELVKIVASAFGESDKRLIPLDRVAAEDGLRRSTGGRGGSAPKMAPTDAASLVLMMLTHMSGVSASLTADRVRRLWGKPYCVTQLVTWYTPVTKKVGTKRHNEVREFIEDIENTLSDFAECMRARCTFGECIAALINDCIGSRMQTFLDKYSDDDNENCKLKIELPRTYASVNFAKTFDGVEDASVTLTVAYRFYDQRNRIDDSEIATTRSMTFLPLLRIAEGFRD